MPHFPLPVCSQVRFQSLVGLGKTIKQTDERTSIVDTMKEDVDSYDFLSPEETRHIK